MFKKTIFSNGGGLGIISDKGPTHPKIKPIPSVLHGNILQPGIATTLDGFFTGYVLYVGVLEEQKKEVLCFYAGKTTDLFQETHYYYCLVRVAENRLVNKYTYSSAREFVWNGRQWK